MVNTETIVKCTKCNTIALQSEVDTNEGCICCGSSEYIVGSTRKEYELEGSLHECPKCKGVFTSKAWDETTRALCVTRELRRSYKSFNNACLKESWKRKANYKCPCCCEMSVRSSIQKV